MRKHVGSLACLKGDFWPVTDVRLTISMSRQGSHVVPK
jgi:hypothetical protein